MGDASQIARAAKHAHWQRVFITAAIATVVTITLDHYGVIRRIINTLPGGNW